MDLSSWLPLAAAVAAAYVGWRVVHTLYLHPLSRVPGPLFAALTSRWLLFIDLAGQRTATIHGLHQKYGPVVRIGPDDLSFADVEAVNDIYTGTKFAKAPVYDLFGRQGLFQMQDAEQHQRRQKRVAHVFAPSSLAVMEPAIHDTVRKLLRSLGRRVGQPIDMLRWFRMLALDVVGELFLGKSFGALDTESTPSFVHDLDAGYLTWSVKGQFPVIYWLMCSLPIPSLRHFLGSGDRLYDYGIQALSDYIGRYGRSSKQKDLLTKLIVGDGSGDVTPLSDEDVAIEITNLVFAATDTTGNTFTFMFWEMAQHPEWQRRLRDELKDVEFVDNVPFNKSLAHLPILDAIISETLRLHPAAPASLQRITSSAGGTVAGMAVPPRTIISSQAHTTQRNPVAFPNPDGFDPERWLSPVGGSEEMRQLILVWGKGKRACLGKTMAMMELRIATAAIVRQFNVSLASPKTNEDMEMTDHFVLIPKGQKCMLVFERAA
ncbi:MAG: hypothetical protein M1832_006419 [Thelocarpon impressellum]|nr:MAG: hypothetical protein M1832_006419 [Thelocarpon impressellum]